jgi:hypothetical protein
LLALCLSIWDRDTSNTSSTGILLFPPGPSDLLRRPINENCCIVDKFNILL